MTDPEKTVPPRQPNTFRSLFRWLYAWSQVHTVAAAAIGGVAAGYFLPKLLRVIFL